MNSNLRETIKQHRLNIAANGVALAALLLVTWWFGWLPLTPEPDAVYYEPETALYVWEPRWDDTTREVLQTAADHAGHLMVLAAVNDEPVDGLDWGALARTDRPVTLVFSYDEGLYEAIFDYAMQAARDVAVIIGPMLQAAGDTGVDIAGIQIDFHHPSEHLRGFEVLLKELFHRFDYDCDISITVRPALLEHKRFPALLSWIDYYVVQTHTFPNPGDGDTPLDVIDTGRIAGYLDQTRTIARPYFLAFPAHNTQGAYSGQGAFLGLLGDAPAPRLTEDHTIRALRADPDAIADYAANLHRDPPPHFRGTAWLRLPASDAPWPWTAIDAVKAAEESG